MTPLNVKDLLLAPRLDREQIAALLSPFGLKDVAKADANLQGMAGEPAERESLEPCDHLTPETFFNRRWALMLLERVMNQLRNECMAARKGELFEKLKDSLTADTMGKSYREIAAELNMSEGAVKVTVHRLRRRFGELVRGQIERTVASPDEIDDEIRQLFAALS